MIDRYPKWQRGDTVAERVDTARYRIEREAKRQNIKFWTIADYVKSKMTPGDRLVAILNQYTYDTRELAKVGQLMPVDDVIAVMKAVREADFKPNVIFRQRTKPPSWFSKFFKGE